MPNLHTSRHFTLVSLRTNPAHLCIVPVMPLCEVDGFRNGSNALELRCGTKWI